MVRRGADAGVEGRLVWRGVEGRKVSVARMWSNVAARGVSELLKYGT